MVVEFFLKILRPCNFASSRPTTKTSCCTSYDRGCSSGNNNLPW